MPARDPVDRVRIATIGAHSLHARYDSRQLTDKARRNGPNTVGWHMARLAKEQPEWESLSPGERHKRGTHAMKAYFRSLRRRSA